MKEGRTDIVKFELLKFHNFYLSRNTFRINKLKKFKGQGTWHSWEGE
jgi:hypothetical protein